jgi:hypothetical protein
MKMTDLSKRERAHIEAHERSLERQILDALLRIEEILDRAFPNPNVKPIASEQVNAKPSGLTKVLGGKSRK